MSEGIPSRFLLALGRVIRRRRLSLGMSQEGFAVSVGLHRTYIGSIERGERNVSIANLLRISDGLRIACSALLANAERESSDHVRH
jgi:transcriptional regulator with XRE-family HTH domain